MLNDAEYTIYGVCVCVSLWRGTATECKVVIAKIGSARCLQQPLTIEDLALLVPFIDDQLTRFKCVGISFRCAQRAHKTQINGQKLAAFIFTKQFNECSPAISPRLALPTNCAHCTRNGDVRDGRRRQRSDIMNAKLNKKMNLVTAKRQDRVDAVENSGKRSAATRFVRYVTYERTLI